ncbi:MAG: hypothetical protein AAGB51_11565 [Planctomycetota bacterium]
MLEKLTRALRGKREEQGPSARLAVFGKHPGWDDHIDDLGVDTDALVGVKRALYIEGVGGNLDSGAWENLGEDGRLPAIHREFVWTIAQRVFVGRMWPSQDGKGRARYPLVGCVETTGLSVPEAAGLSLPVLQELEQTCSGTTDAAGVREAHANAAAALSAGVPATAGTNEGLSPSGIQQHQDLGPERTGLFRIAYQIDRDFGAMGSGPRTHTGERAQDLRVPSCGVSAGDSLCGWHAFFAWRLESRPLLLLRSVPMGWVDVVVGGASAAKLSCLLKNEHASPLTSMVPYTLDEGFLDRARRLFG